MLNARRWWGTVVFAFGALFATVPALAAPQDAPALLTLAMSPRIFVTLVPRAAEPDEPYWRGLDATDATRPRLKLPMRTVRPNRLEFSLVHTDVIANGDRLRLRMASDAHIVAQLLSGGQFSSEDDSWIAVLGFASRVKMSYDYGPWELSVSARRKFGDSDVRARFGYAVRF